MTDSPVELEALDLAQLALFVGQAVNAAVLDRLQERGYTGLRTSHGYLVMHLLRGPHSVGELAGLLGVTQQAVSKTVAELARSNYVEAAPSADARVRMLRLSARGRAAVKLTRSVREELEQQLSAAVGRDSLQAARAVMIQALDRMQARPAIRERRLKPPR